MVVKLPSVYSSVDAGWVVHFSHLSILCIATQKVCVILGAFSSRLRHKNRVLRHTCVIPEMSDIKHLISKMTQMTQNALSLGLRKKKRTKVYRLFKYTVV